MTLSILFFLTFCSFLSLSGYCFLFVYFSFGSIYSGRSFPPLLTLSASFAVSLSHFYFPKPNPISLQLSLSFSFNPALYPLSFAFFPSLSSLHMHSIIALFSFTSVRSVSVRSVSLHSVSLLSVSVRSVSIQSKYIGHQCAVALKINEIKIETEYTRRQ